MARRKKTNIGRRHKYYEKRIQDCRKNKPRSGLQLTVKSFVEVSKYLLEQQGVHYLLSERFSKTLLKISLGNKEPMEVGVKTQLYSNS